MTAPPGTFLIRFSDGEIGGVSIAWVVLKADGKLVVIFLVKETTVF